MNAIVSPRQQLQARYSELKLNVYCNLIITSFQTLGAKKVSHVWSGPALTDMAFREECALRLADKNVHCEMQSILDPSTWFTHKG